MPLRLALRRRSYACGMVSGARLLDCRCVAAEADPLPYTGVLDTLQWVGCTIYIYISCEPKRISNYLRSFGPVA